MGPQAPDGVVEIGKSFGRLDQLFSGNLVPFPLDLLILGLRGRGKQHDPADRKPSHDSRPHRISSFMASRSDWLVAQGAAELVLGGPSLQIA
jgi:hypothetical protein